MSKYAQSWHARYGDKTEESARRVLRHVFAMFHPASFLEVGCGLGHWTKVALELGVKDAVGVDGAWTSIADLVIPAAQFIEADLERPLDLGRRFDVLVTLEVAEHLGGTAADSFIDSLVRHADLIVFGAAIPLQGGLNHVNEQWPNFWIAKFKQRRFRAFDLLRPIFWGDRDIHYWYRQNTIVMINEDRHDLIDIATAELLRIARDYPPMDMVHPEKYQEMASYETIAVRRLLPQLPRALWKPKALWRMVTARSG
jgi:SAM-dependent methyltransferase